MASHPWSSDIDEFFAVLLASYLLSYDDFQRACSLASATQRDADALDKLCRELVDLDLVTQWQCDKLRNRKYKGFHIDSYCLLSEIEKTDMEAIYVARDLRDGSKVKFAITPRSRSPEYVTKFRVVEKLEE